MNQPMLKIPPHSIEAEEAVLGALLIDPDSLVKITDLLNPEDFYKEAHGLIYATACELFERHEPIDLLTLGNRLKEKDQIKLIGGQTKLVELTNTVATSSGIASHAEIVRKKSTLRRLLAAANKISELAFQESEDVDMLVDDAERTLMNVSEQFDNKSFVPMRSVLTEAFERIDEAHKNRGQKRGLPTGFTGLDNLLSGLQPSDLIILAARPSVGKTSLALDIARNVALLSKKPVGIFSLEMAKEQLVDRMICAQAGVDLWKLRNGRLSDRDEDFPKIGEALSKLSEAPIFIDDSPTANIITIRSKARRLKAEHDLGMIVIDYLQLMEGRTNKSDNRTQEVAEISRGLKQIARELSVPVVALAQLSRAVENTKPAIPRLSHLRESGSIEQDADVVMFLYRKSRDGNYQPDELSPQDQVTGKIIIAKHRNGPTGDVDVYWDGKTTSFKNLDKYHTPPPAPVPGAGGPPVMNNKNIGLPAGIPPKQ
jgi:replicative DNA helicase